MTGDARVAVMSVTTVTIKMISHQWVCSVTITTASPTQSDTGPHCVTPALTLTPPGKLARIHAEEL